MSVLSGWALARGRDLGRQPLAARADGRLGTTATADTADAACVSGATIISADRVRMTTRQLLVACTVNCFQLGGGPLLSATATGRLYDRSHRTSLPLHQRRVPHFHRPIVRPHTISAPKNGRSGQPNRTIPIATAPYAV